MFRTISKFLQKGRPPLHPYAHMVASMHNDDFFQTTYRRGMELTNSKISLWRMDRFYNLVEALRSTKDIQGIVAECGCYKGLSSYLLCSELKRERSGFRGDGYHIYDSFEGLSLPNEKEQADITRILNAPGKGLFSASEDLVRQNLSSFPEVSFHKGFIPGTLDPNDKNIYRFVHIDLDLVEPTMAATKHFYSRLAEGGMIVCDDYGSHLWRETKTALDQFCAEQSIQMIGLSTGQALLIKFARK